MDKVRKGEVRKRENSLAVTFPDVAAEWHPTKNGRFTPEVAAPRGTQKVWWLCIADVSHEWEATIHNRTANRSGCPFCAGSRASRTENLAVLHPDLLAEWDFEANTLDPYRCRPGSNAMAHWVCDKGPDHRWQMPIHRRVSGQGCLCCQGLKLSVSNSVASHERAAALWAEDLNEHRPEEVIAAGATEYYWRCQEGPDHVWQATPYRIISGKSCPFCAGKRPSVTNNLATLYPHIAAELAESGVDASTILAHSHKKLHWKCAVDSSHTWTAVVKDRTLDKIGCPFCFTPSTSRREVELASELETLIGGAWNTRVTGASGKTWTCDYSNETYRIVVEYDGNRWHESRSERDVRKTEDLEAVGWRVLRIREKGLEKISSRDIQMASQWSTRHMTREIIQAFINEGAIPDGVLAGYTKRKRPLGADLAEERLLTARTVQNQRDRLAGRAPPARRRVTSVRKTQEPHRQAPAA